MNASQRVQYEMLLRLRDFGNTHRDLFATSPVAQEAFAAVDRAISELTATDLLKTTASAAARTNRQARARRVLIELLGRASVYARVLQARGEALPVFALPASKSDQALLSAARQFAHDARPFDAEFSAHGVGAMAISQTGAALEKALRDRGMNRADRTEANTRIRDLLAAAFLDVRRLDLIVNSALADNNGLRAVWKRARRVEFKGGSNGGATGSTAEEPPEAQAEPTVEPIQTPAPAAVDVPATPAAPVEAEPTPAPAVDTPSREVA